MRPTTFLLLRGVFAGCPAVSDAQEVPVIAGYVTRAASASDFDVNSVRIVCSDKAGDRASTQYDVTIAVVKCPGQAPNIGEKFAIHYTLRNKDINVIYATRIDEQHTTSLGRVSGSAVIDAMSAEKAVGGKPTDLTVRADGYRIIITANTKIDWNPPVQWRADVKAGGWIKYKGKIDAAGVLSLHRCCLVRMRSVRERRNCMRQMNMTRRQSRRALSKIS